MWKCSTSYGAAWALPPMLKHLRAGSLHAIVYECYECNVIIPTNVNRHDYHKRRDPADGELKRMLTVTLYHEPDFQTFTKFGPFAKSA